MREAAMTGPNDVGEAWRALGKQLSEFRKAAGYTQHSLAPKTISARSTIANAETGRQRPDRTFWERCDEVLQTGGILATSYDRVVALQRNYQRKSAIASTASVASAQTDPTLPACDVQAGAADEIASAHSTAADDTTIVTVMIEGRPQRVQLSRRALLHAVSGSLMAPFAGVDVALWADTVRVDPALVEHFAVLRSVLVESDNRVGAAAILPTARQQLGHIAGFRRAARGGLHDAFLRTEARWAEFAGWLSDDLGDRAAGDWWLAQALTMAQEAGDAEFTAYVFARMAQRAAEATDRDRVLGLARAADRSGSAQAPVRAFAALQRAHGHVIAGNTSAFQAAIDDAHHLVASAPADDGDLGSFCTVPYVWAQEGDGWRRLGQPHAAITCFDRALDAWPESYRRERGLYLARTAAAYAAAGEPERAATTGLTALELAHLTQSARTSREVAAVGCHLTKTFPAEPGVADLHAALAASPHTT
ncbi:helix-turn-helix transcriptional regulator [Micromonospora sp. NPDC047738]|uniref:helix-turn-helix domain-containing protein n=1 Tax=Micromonospora sp. NPDC047738 TaxID=3155741 RepID=UPI0033E83937